MRKKAKDAQYTVFENTGWGTPFAEKSSGLSMVEQISTRVRYVRFLQTGENLTLRAGVYNVFNRKKYHLGLLARSVQLAPPTALTAMAKARPLSRPRPQLRCIAGMEILRS